MTSCAISSTSLIHPSRDLLYTYSEHIRIYNVDPKASSVKVSSPQYMAHKLDKCGQQLKNAYLMENSTIRKPVVLVHVHRHLHLRKYRLLSSSTHSQFTCLFLHSSIGVNLATPVIHHVHSHAVVYWTNRNTGTPLVQGKLYVQSYMYIADWLWLSERVPF